ncbi:MAG: FAD-binding oxidoreductase [Thermoleophilaceae bacterium]
MELATLGAQLADQLRSRFSGEIYGPGDKGYDDARRVKNGMIDRRPALIGRPADEDDVAALVDLARERGLDLAVRCGGHGVSGHGTCDGGIVIDLSGLDSISVDPAAKLATAGGGVDWGRLDAATQEHGLAVTGGRVPSTGIGGLTLGSGSGWLERKYGLTCDSLSSARVVLADGSLVTASPFQNEDLFWGLRGGGGNFGVVTSFTYELHEVGPIVLGGMLLYPRAMAPELMRFYRDFIESAPDEVGGGVAFISAPPHDPVPKEVQGQPMVGVIVVYVGDVKDGEEALRPLMEFGPPAMAMVQPMPYTAFQMLLNDAFPEGAHVYFKAEFMDELTDDAIDTVIEMAAEPTSPMAQVLFQPMGGAIARVSPDETALPVRDAKWCYHALTVWLPEMGPDEVHVGWTKALAAAMKPYAAPGIYLNFIADEGQERVISSYGRHYEKLVALKDRYDPGNLFRVNQNIKPSAG